MGVGGKMGRLLGLGFIFGAKDDGASRSARTLRQELEGTDRAMSHVNQTSASSRMSSMFSRAATSVTMARSSMTNMAGAVSSVVSEMGKIPYRSTSLEQFGAQASADFARVTAGMGPLRQEMVRMRGQITGAAFSTGESVSSITESIAGLGRQGISLRQLGLSVRNVAGLIHAGLDPASIGTTFGFLRGQFGLTIDEARRFANEQVAMGESVGLGRDVLQHMTPVLQANQQALAQMSTTYTDGGRGVMRFTQGVMRLAAASTRAGINGGDMNANMEASLGVFRTLATEQTTFSRLFTGLGSDIGDLTQELGIFGGSTDAAFQQIRQDPLLFVRNMRSMVAGMPEARRNTYLDRLTQVLGETSPALVAMIRNTTGMGPALDAVNAPLANTSGAIARLSRQAGGVARTFSESLQLMSEGFTTHLNSISRRTMPHFMQRQAAAFRSVSATIDRFVRDDGPLGSLTRGFMRVRAFGFSGISPEIGAFAHAMTPLTESIVPVVTALGSFGMAAMTLGPAIVGVLSSLWGVAAAAAAFVGWPVILGAGLVALVANFERVGPAVSWVRRKIEQGLNALDGLGARFTGWVNRIDWQGMGKRLASNAVAAVRAVWGAITSPSEESNGKNRVVSFLRTVLSGAWSALRGFGDGIWTVLRNVDWAGVQSTVVTALTNIDWASYRARAWAGLQGAWIWMQGRMEGAWRSILGVIGGNEAFQRLSLAVRDFVGEASPALGRVIDYALDQWDALKRAGLAVWTELSSGVRSFWNDSIGPIFAAVTDGGGDMWATLRDAAATAWSGIQAITGAVWNGFLRPVLLAIGAAAVVTWEGIKIGARVMWQGYVKPMFQVMRIGATVLFGAVAMAGVTAFYAIYGAISTLDERWQLLKATVVGGARVIGATIRSGFLLALHEGADVFEDLFLKVSRGTNQIRLGFVGMSLAVIDSLNSLVSHIPAALMPAGLRGIATGVLGSAGRALRVQEASLLATERTATAADVAREAARRARNQGFLAAVTAETSAASAQITSAVTALDRAQGAVDSRASAARERIGSATARGVRSALGDSTAEGTLRPQVAVSAGGRLRREGRSTGAEATARTAPRSASVASASMPTTTAAPREGVLADVFRSESGRQVQVLEQIAGLLKNGRRVPSGGNSEGNPLGTL